jgi:DNA-nicking Smr family endonuclease
VKGKGKPSAPRVKKPALTPEEQAEFLAAIGGTTPLDGRDRVPPPPPPKAVIKPAVLPAEVKLAVEGDASRYAARGPGVSRAQIDELRAGKLRVEDTLDLHGLATEPGRAALRQFTVEAARVGRRCVLIVHGKGTHSEVGAVLREAVLHELLGPLSGLVHALASAAPRDGGEGATYVMLRGGGR